LFFLSLIPANAQYYTSAFGKNGPILKTALHGIIQGHTVGTYADLWADYFTTDNKGGNIVWDIYSDIPVVRLRIRIPLVQVNAVPIIVKVIVITVSISGLLLISTTTYQCIQTFK
jgi:hypothetical protein